MNDYLYFFILDYTIVQKVREPKESKYLASGERA